MTDQITYMGHAGIGERVRGSVLAASDGFSARYDLDRIKGVFSRPEHKLYGENYVGRILVLDGAKGGVATAWMLYEMASRDMAPLALLLNRSNPVMAQGTALAGITLVDRFDVDITRVLKTGDEIEVEPKTGTVTLLKR